MNRSLLRTLLAAILLLVFRHPDVTAQINEAGQHGAYRTKVFPLLKKYCIDCHAPGGMEAFDFLAVTSSDDVATHRELFATVVEQLESGAMPTADAEQPSATERTTIINWIKQTLDLKPEESDRIAQYVVEIFEDRKGNLWFGTVNQGVARYDGAQLKYFTTADGLPDNTVTSLAEDKNGTLWVGTHNGVGKFDGERFLSVKIGDTQFVPGKSSPETSAGVSTDNEGMLWASVGRRLFRFAGTDFVEFELPIPSEETSSYAILAGDASFQLQDSAGNYWFSSDGYGVFKFDGKSFTHYSSENGLCSNNVTSIIEDQHGHIWFTCIQSFQPRMTGDGGLCRFDGKSFHTFTDQTGLTGADLYTIKQTQSGDIWIGATGVGLYRYDGKSFRLFDESDRPLWLRNFGTQAILEDRQGTLWFGMSGGLFRFNGKSFFNVTKSGPWKSTVESLADILLGNTTSSDGFPKEVQASLITLAGGDFDAARSKFLQLQEDNPDEGSIQEDVLNRLGYHLVGQRRLDFALNIFELNTSLYPNAFNTYDSLGEAYLFRGDYQKAEVNFRKSLKLNPGNENGLLALQKIESHKRFDGILVAPKNWAQEVIVCPPGFAPDMSLTGMEHLRLPPEFREPDSEWFLSYLFAIELSEPTDFKKNAIREQLLLYFRGLASGAADENGLPIDTEAFAIESTDLPQDSDEQEFAYVLNWREPFAGGKQLEQTVRVKLLEGISGNDVLFVASSPQPFGSNVWNQLLAIRSDFEINVTTQ